MLMLKEEWRRSLFSALAIILLNLIAVHLAIVAMVIVIAIVAAMATATVMIAAMVMGAVDLVLKLSKKFVLY
jgi:hypothetical protein